MQIEGCARSRYGPATTDDLGDARTRPTSRKEPDGAPGRHRGHFKPGARRADRPPHEGPMSGRAKAFVAKASSARTNLLDGPARCGGGRSR